MIKRIINATLLILLILISLRGISWAEDTAPIPYSSTFNCSDVTVSSLGAYTACDHQPSAWQTYNATGGQYSQITASANYSGGAGGKGYRRYNGLSTNDQSSGVDINWYNGGSGDNGPGAALSEFYFMFMVRWESGTDYGSDVNAGQKLMYFNNNGASFYLNTQRQQIRISDGSFNIGNGSYGTDALWGQTTSTGAWYCIQGHVKGETSVGAGNGQFHLKIDGTERLASTSVPYGFTNFWGFVLPSNGDAVLTQIRYQDVDDISVSTTDYPACPSGGGGNGGQDSNPTIRHFEIKFINHVFGAPLLFERGSF